MPFYNYKCPSCGATKVDLKSMSEFDPNETFDCKCGDQLVYQMSDKINSTVYETKDHYRGVQLPKNQDKNLKERMREHHDKYELEEKIDKYGMKEAMRSGWLKKVKKI